MHDVIVIGLGGLGSAAAYWAASRGLDVLGLERFTLGHHRGGSQDHSRVIRLAHDQQVYGRLAEGSFAAWDAVEAESGVQLVTRTGGLIIENPRERDDATAVTGGVDAYVSVANALGHPHETLTAEEVMRRWPEYRLDGDERAMYSEDAGLVDARRANATHAALARAHGADLRTGIQVLDVLPSGDGVEVRTTDGVHRAARAIVTTGAWTSGLIARAGVDIDVTVTLEQVTYYATPHLAAFSPSRFPVFLWRGAHAFYGFPVYGEVATKLGQHLAGPVVDPDDRTFDPDPVRQNRYRRFLEERLPRFLGPELETKTCLYACTPDDHFILDTLPESPQIAVAVGAGHAFKHASNLGKLLAELVVDGAANTDISAFSLQRPSLRGSALSDRDEA